MNNESLLKLLAEYKETKKCLETGLNWLEEKDYAKGKLDIEIGRASCRERV